MSNMGVYTIRRTEEVGGRCDMIKSCVLWGFTPYPLKTSVREQASSVCPNFVPKRVVEVLSLSHEYILGPGKPGRCGIACLLAVHWKIW